MVSVPQTTNLFVTNYTSSPRMRTKLSLVTYLLMYREQTSLIVRVAIKTTVETSKER